MPERSKGEVLRTSVLNYAWVRTPLAAKNTHFLKLRKNKEKNMKK